MGVAGSNCPVARFKSKDERVHQIGSSAASPVYRGYRVTIRVATVDHETHVGIVALRATGRFCNRTLIYRSERRAVVPADFEP